MGADAEGSELRFQWDRVTDADVWESLDEAGWAQDRVVALDGYAQFFSSMEMEFIAAAQAVLSRFGGLELDFTARPGNLYGPRPVRFSPEQAMMADLELVEGISERLGEVVCPIGTWGDAQAVLIGTCGEVYSSSEFFLLKLGRFEDALRCFARRDRPVEDMMLWEGWY